MSLVRSSRLVAVALLLLVLSACVGGVEDTGDDGFISGSGEITFIDPGKRKPAPVLSGTDLEGQPLSTEDFAGKVLVVNLWGSWCAPCRKEAPALQKASAELADQNVQFVGLLTKDDPASAKAFNAKFDITYPSIDDSAGRNQAAFADTLPSMAIPTTWVIDSNGKVAARVMGELTDATLRGLVEQTKKSTQ
ncbi:redoxin domain-containing protein [Aeromicrobium sp. 636]|uniref:TlpA family protein disulfide reductase n=1 Tax=Aeromicrobium senzhongii TaxID=2663859 RepID=A0A8I0EX72_9ACTN|nr:MULTISPECIES: TlpA disulfide reductase family protein [Aeromicrobium]MBC9227328.1 TlpA family protein disulfide reductase [Aeromicrobium senzhongii]MCQ3999426.1 redoxin domain-containing protein [Aeromicrobium sp. 636]MTB88262.1 redoxin domain-containing protein [Aeromicrobium senzhongii]QNL94755.1 TlpA family protein disulfide reductase [Aeromicrobium senzhongii]